MPKRPAPCGHCRQFLFETTTGANLEILIPGQQPLRLSTFLPMAFGPENLGVAAHLMSRQDHGFVVPLITADRLVHAAFVAANTSYAPYSNGYAGVAIETTCGTIYSGRYAENAAYNPSLSPMQAALAMWRLGNGAQDGIARAVLAFHKSKIDHVTPTAEMLASFSSVSLEVYHD